jgi:hypothetical protein
MLSVWKLNRQLKLLYTGSRLSWSKTGLSSKNVPIAKAPNPQRHDVYAGLLVARATAQVDGCYRNVAFFSSLSGSRGAHPDSILD